jgi:dienelactone hydrolase
MKNIQTHELIYKNHHSHNHDNTPLHGFYAYDDSFSGKRPVVLVAHDWRGRNEFAEKNAQLLAEMGYIGFAIDMYGKGQQGKTKEEKLALMQPLMNDRTLLCERIVAAVHAIESLPQADTSNIAAIGFCFGGLCVLDLARSAADIRGVVSFHGLLGASPLHLPKLIKAKILALHGQDDPMVPPEQVQCFAEEMTTAQADWQLHIYGNTTHAFMNPQANDPEAGLVYNPQTEKRAWRLAEDFLREIFD